MKKEAVLSVAVFLALVGSGAAYRVATASDHDDGENDAKARALNLTDHYMWKDTTDATKVNLVQYSNPRSLAGYQYHFSTQARYEIHVTRVADKKAVPTGSDDFTFRFMFQAPDATNTQAFTMTVLNGGVEVGSDTTGKTTPLAVAQSAAGDTINSITIGGKTYKVFAGMRADSFFFDVTRFFQVRAFLADRFLNGNANAKLDPTCDGKALGAAGGDGVHLFNPPSCAPDFTKNFNVNAIAVQADIAALQANGETTFDSWSTISIPQ